MSWRSPVGSGPEPERERLEFGRGLVHGVDATEKHAQPLMTPKGSSRATRREIPAPAMTATTRATSL
jgi:hypothetical protein